MTAVVSSLSIRVAALRESLRELDVELLSGDACRRLAEELAGVEKSCAALRALAAARAANCGAHVAAGHLRAEDWLARLTGASRQQARGDLATGTRLADCSATKDAALAGELSLGQADEIARTEAETPGSEEELLAIARGSGRQELADACRKRRQQGVDRDQLAARQRSLRSHRSWTDGDGMVCGRYRLEPVHGVPFLTRLQRETDRRHRDARRQGTSEPWEAHAADALVSMLDAESANTTERTRRRKAEVVFVVDLRTFRTGEHEGSVCHLLGGGPVAPDVVREVAKDAFLKVAFHDGVDVQTVTHLGRYIPAELRTALELGAPPAFEGAACSGCGRRFRLEWDHVEPICTGGRTTFANQDAKCWECHRRKSDAERAAGLYDRTAGAPRPRPP